MTHERYYDERSAILAALGLDPDEDDVWASPDNDEADSFAVDYRAEMMRLADDPWGEEEEHI